MEELVEPKGLETSAPGVAPNVGTECEVVLVLVGKLC